MPKPQFTLHIPEDYDGNKHRSIDAYHGRDELQWQGAHRHEGALIVRFELMFKVKCLGCEEYVSMGNRYNADKRIIGKYHSTPVYKFTMNCHICLFQWEIRTDPETLDYICMSGCRRKQEQWDTRDVNGLTTIDSEVKKKLLGDKMFNKEYKSDDKRKACIRADELRFEQVSREIRKYDWDINRELRKQAKDRREKEQAKEKEKMDFKKTKGVALDELVVLSSDEEDGVKAKELLEKSVSKRKLLDEKMMKSTFSSKIVPGWGSDSEDEQQIEEPPEKIRKESDPKPGSSSTNIITIQSGSESEEDDNDKLLPNKKKKLKKLDESVSAEQQMFLNKKRNSAKDAKTILLSNLGTDLSRNILGKGRKTEMALQNSKFKNFSSKSSSSSLSSKNSLNSKTSISSNALSSQSRLKSMASKSSTASPFGGGLKSSSSSLLSKLSKSSGSNINKKSKLAAMVRLKK